MHDRPHIRVCACRTGWTCAAHRHRQAREATLDHRPDDEPEAPLESPEFISWPVID